MKRAIAAWIAELPPVRGWLGITRTVAVVDRMAPALVELDQFYELLDASGPGSHFLERHGPMLKTQEILQRAETGRLDMCGLAGKPVASASWLRHADLLHAASSALRHWELGVRPHGGRFAFQFAGEIGEGFLKGGGSLARTRVAIVIIRNGQIITAYPALTAPAEGEFLTSSL